MRKLESLDLEWLPSGTTQFVLVRTPYPDIPNLVHLVLAATVSRATIDALMVRLPEGQSLSFFDPVFPSPSDPGAYFRIERSSGTLFIRAANHGWSTGWRVIDPARAADHLRGCRHSSMQPEQALTLGLEGGHPRAMDNDPQSVFARRMADRLAQIDSCCRGG
jgi:hypothetical protein